MGVQVCPACGNILADPRSMYCINECRGLYLWETIVEHPGLSAWELHMLTGMSYKDVSSGLEKARALGWVKGVSEEREQGGIRYRYAVAEEAAFVTIAEEHSIRVKRGYAVRLTAGVG